MVAVPPILNTELREILLGSSVAAEAVRTFGSPVHLIVPNALLRNVSEFRAVLHSRGVEGRILYACKVNNCESLLDAAALAECDVEVSSTEELRAALGAGFDGSRILVSGPVKSARYLRLAVQHGCCISLDDLSEINAVPPGPLWRGKRISLLFRMSGFSVTRVGRNEPAPPHIEQSRFGIAMTEARTLVSLLDSNGFRQRFDVIGLSFHIDNHSIQDRRAAIWQLLPLLLEIRERGFAARVIDVGGGFSTRYVDARDWKEFHNAYATALLRGKSGFMFRDKTFGVVLHDGAPINRGNFYPYDTDFHGPAFLDELISGSEAGLADVLRERNVELWVEPGKSLVDQAGATIARVRAVRPPPNGGTPLAILEMNITNLYEQFIGSEFVSDPILLGCGVRREANSCADQVSLHLAGNLCLEGDMLAWRRVPFGRLLVAGDILAFANTAGYQMDFADSGIHRIGRAERLAVMRSENRWTLTTDSNYSGLEDEAVTTILGVISRRAV